MLRHCLFRGAYWSSKIYHDAQKAIQGVKDGSFLLVGGFGFCGVPMNLVNALRLSGAKNLKIASNSCGVDGKNLQTDWGLSMLLRTRQIKRLTFSHLGQNVQSQRQYFAGELELDVCPQGTLAEKIRAGGAGIPAFYTPTGVDTVVETGGFPIKFKEGSNGTIPQLLTEPKPTRIFNGKKYLMEESIVGDFALIKAKRAQKCGNLQFHKTARNFNADMARAARVVVAEVEEIVEDGTLDPESIHVPSLYVDRIYQMDPASPYSQSVIERLTVQDHIQVKRKVKFSVIKEGKLVFDDTKLKSNPKEQLRYRIARRAAREVTDGMKVNLGIGIPTCLPEVLPSHTKINLHSENGVLGVGHHPLLQEVDPDNINAGKETITLNPGGSYFSSSDSFAMVRGGHLDVTMLGSFEVSESCDIANWTIPGKVMKGMGGAMDLVSCGSRVIVLMQHSAVTKGKRELKLLPKCSLPLTAKGVVSLVITELAVFQNQGGHLVCIEIAEETTQQEVQNQTGFPIVWGNPLGRF